MHYLVLLYGDETTAAEPGSPAFEAELAAYGAFDELAAGAIRGGAALELSSTARTIVRGGGAVTVTDGPFTETTEALGGYYVLEADDLDRIIDLVRHLPATTDPSGCSEIRPLVTDELLREEGEALPDLWLATTHRSTPADEATAAAATSAGDRGEARAAHASFVATHRDRIVRGAAVHGDRSATTVRVRDGEVLVTDGPPPGVTAVAGGLYVIQGTADEAEAVARDIPLGDGEVVELRPILDLGAFD